MIEVTPIYQEPGSFSCLGCVAAMIAGDPDLSRLAQHAGHDGLLRPFRMVEISGYLATRNILLGGYADKPVVFWRRISIRWPRQFQALLIVQQTSGKGAHAVYWTGSEVIDPVPENRGRKLSQYVVLQWWPVIIVD